MKKGIILILSAAVFTSLLFPSCATIITGTKTPMYVSSYPAGATVKVNGVEKGVTPITLIVKRNTFKKAKIEVSKKDFKTEKLAVKKKFVFWSLITLIPVGNAIDALTGAIINYSPKINFVDLTERNSTTVKKYNPDDFCYIVNDKKDTTYCYPEINQKIFSNKKKYRDFATGKEKEIPLKNILALKQVELKQKRYFLWYPIGMEECEEAIYERRTASLKKTDKTDLLKLVLRNGEYSLFSTSEEMSMDYIAISGAEGGASGSGGGGSVIVYFLYKGDKLIEDAFTRRKTFEKYKQYFESQKPLAYPKNKEEYEKILEKEYK